MAGDQFHEKLSLCYQHINHNPSDERFLSESSEENSSTSGDMEQELLNDQFNETPANRSKRRSSVDIFFSENTPIIEEQNEIVENQPLMPEIIETLETNEEEQAEESNITLQENANNDILEEPNSEHALDEPEIPVEQAQEEEEFVSVSSNKKRRKKKNKNKNN